MQKWLEAKIEKYRDNFIQAGNLKKLALHGTTILALKYHGGVVMAGDMRMCGEIQIISDHFEKIFQINGGDSLIAVSGVTAIALQTIKFLNLEIEYYEKMEETTLSFEGKANLLGQIIGKFLPLVMNGLVVIPILASRNKIYAFGPLGSKWAVDYHITGSGSPFTTVGLKKACQQELTRDEAVKIALETLKDAAGANQHTGPGVVVYTIEDKISKLSEQEMQQIAGGDSHE